MAGNQHDIEIKDKIVSTQTHATDDVTCGGSLGSPEHRLSKKIEKSLFDGISMNKPTEENEGFVYRNEKGDVMVSKRVGRNKYKWNNLISEDEKITLDEIDEICK